MLANSPVAAIGHQLTTTRARWAMPSAWLFLALGTRRKLVIGSLIT